MNNDELKAKLTQFRKLWDNVYAEARAFITRGEDRRVIENQLLPLVLELIEAEANYRTLEARLCTAIKDSGLEIPTNAPAKIIQSMLLTELEKIKTSVEKSAESSNVWQQKIQLLQAELVPHANSGMILDGKVYYWDNGILMIADVQPLDQPKNSSEPESDNSVFDF